MYPADRPMLHHDLATVDAAAHLVALPAQCLGSAASAHGLSRAKLACMIPPSNHRIRSTRPLVGVASSVFQLMVKNIGVAAE